MYPLLAPQAFRLCCRHFFSNHSHLCWYETFRENSGSEYEIPQWQRSLFSLSTWCKSPICSSLIKEIVQSAIKAEIWLGSYKIKTHLQGNGRGNCKIL